MKKTLIVLAFLAALFCTEKAQAQLNIHVGYAPEFFSTKTPAHDSIMFFLGFNIGLGWEFDLGKNFSLNVGAQYRMSLRDAIKPRDPASPPYMPGTGYREKQQLVDIPILFKYNVHGGEKFTFSPFVGPMLSCGIYAKSTPVNNPDTHHYWYKDNGVAYHPNKRFNLYAVAGFEFDIFKISISFGGRYGFLNLNKNTDTTTRAVGFFFNFGHTF